MTPDQRMKWDAEAAFKRIDEQMGYSPSWEARSDVALMKTTPYTPPPNVAAWLQAQADKPKPRDYDAILRAAKKAPVGYYEDAPRGIKFGGQPLPSAGSKPHGKDVDTADGGTPLIGMFGQERLWFGGMEYTARGRAMPCRRDAAMCWWQNTRTPTIPEMHSWLEQNGHADAAAQLRVTPRDDVATGGGRVWRDKSMTSRINLNGVAYGHSLDNRPTIWQLDCSEELNEQCATDYGYVELFGHERDAVLAECRKAMGL